MKLNDAYKIIMFFQYIVKPILGHKTKRYQIQCAHKYIEFGMLLRRAFIYIVSAFFLMMTVMIYSLVYFLVFFPNEADYTSSIQFWLALLGLGSIILTILTVCSQRVWIKVLKINELLAYIEIDKNNNA